MLIVHRGLPSSGGSEAATGKAFGQIFVGDAKCDITARGGAWGSVNVPDSDRQFLHQHLRRPSKMAG